MSGENYLSSEVKTVWTLLLLFGIHCLFPGIYLIIIMIVAKYWPFLLGLLVVLVFATICNREKSSTDHSQNENSSQRNNRIRVEGKIGTTNVSTPTEDQLDGVPPEYAAYYVIFKGKK